MMSPGTFWELLKGAAHEWSEDKVPRLGAALAFYSALSLAPLLVIAIAVAASFFQRSQVQDQVIAQFGGLVGPEGARAIRAMIENAQKPGHGIVATILGVGTLLFAASGVFGELQDALNTIWEVQPKPGRGIWGLIRDRFLSLTMVLGTGFLLLVSLILSTALAALGHFVGGLLPGGASPLIQAANFVVTLGVVALLFALIFKYLPDVTIAWGDVWVGAGMTALLFGIGKFALGEYLGRASVGSAYGAAGSLVVLLVWIYYSAQILYFGAEFTQVYANRYGSRIEPARDAEPVTEAARAEQGVPHRERPADAPPGARPGRGAPGRVRPRPRFVPPPGVPANRFQLPQPNRPSAPAEAEPAPSLLTVGGVVAAVAGLAFLYRRWSDEGDDAEA